LQEEMPIANASTKTAPGWADAEFKKLAATHAAVQFELMVDLLCSQ
jgi:hypothetical protein